MHVQDIPLDRIQIRDRSRKEIRNIASLAESMRVRGPLQPIVVRRDGADFVLVAGGRRIEAAKSLKWASISANIVDNLDDEMDALLAEGEENTEREGFTPSESVAHAERIEAVERARAELRRREGNRRGGKASPGPGTGALALEIVAPEAAVGAGEVVRKFRTTSEPALAEPRAAKPIRAKDAVAKASGLGSGRTLEKAQHVVQAAQNPNAPEAVREEARAAVEQMDRTGKVDPAYRKVRDTEAALADAPLDDFLAQSAALGQAKLRLAITKSVIGVREGLPKLSAAHCAEAMEDGQWEEILRAQEILGDWIEELRILRKPAGLRLVN